MTEGGSDRKIHIRLSEDTHRQLRSRCAELDVTIQDYVAGVIEDSLEAHYMKYLTDGDWAQNNAGWQWSAGCGCDAQPYFRVFNPVTQGKKFDPDGNYVQQWVPELAKMPARHIHCPWEAPDTVLEDAGVHLGDNYPRPAVDHKQARQRYLDVAGAHLKGGKR